MKKTALFLLTIMIFISTAFILQRKLDKEAMSSYEYDKGTLGIAVSRILTSKSVVHNFGKPIYPEDEKKQYVWIYIKLLNSSTNAVQVKPQEFTLSIPGKDPVIFDTKATGSMQKCLKETTLEPDKESIGVLIFPLPRSSDYILHYNGPEGKIKKRIVIEAP